MRRTCEKSPELCSDFQRNGSQHSRWKKSEDLGLWSSFAAAWCSLPGLTHTGYQSGRQVTSFHGQVLRELLDQDRCVFVWQERVSRFHQAGARQDRQAEMQIAQIPRQSPPKQRTLWIHWYPVQVKQMHAASNCVFEYVPKVNSSHWSVSFTGAL